MSRRRHPPALLVGDRLLSHPASMLGAALLGAALLASGCGNGSSSYPDVTVSTPEVSTEGATLTLAQWRHSVGHICRRAAVEVGGASQQLSRQINASDEVRDEGEISRMAFDLAKPAFEEQLRALAELRPPAALADGYQGFIASLAQELLWTGRIAQMLGTDADDEDLQAADDQLAASAQRAGEFVRRNHLAGCMLAAGGGG